jgi:hypothetical protein
VRSLTKARPRAHETEVQNHTTHMPHKDQCTPCWVLAPLCRPMLADASCTLSTARLAPPGAHGRRAKHRILRLHAARHPSSILCCKAPLLHPIAISTNVARPQHSGHPPQHSSHPHSCTWPPLHDLLPKLGFQRAIGTSSALGPAHAYAHVSGWRARASDSLMTE